MDRSSNRIFYPNHQTAEKKTAQPAFAKASIAASKLPAASEARSVHAQESTTTRLQQCQIF
jgi:hypothetical protein